jgi:hypothetical protein
MSQTFPHCLPIKNFNPTLNWSSALCFGRFMQTPLWQIQVKKMKTTLLEKTRPAKKWILPALVLALLLSGCSTLPGATLTIDPQSSEPTKVTSGV